MSNKEKFAKKGSPARTSEPDELEQMRARLLALYAVLPTEQASATIREYCQDYGNLDLTMLSNVLREQVSADGSGSLQSAGNMLAAQAHTLDAIFNNLARSAVNVEYVDQLERYLALALRAQSQCRNTWAAVAAIQNPPVMGYVKQANIAHGPQQVNNTVAAT